MYPYRFLSYQNFELAFTRLVRGSNKEYKQFYRHLFPSYNMALGENLSDIIKDIKRGTYQPSKATLIFQPKKSGILRPLSLLTLRDLIVYQAIVNLIADEFLVEQKKYALKTSFGAVYAGKTSPFFYRSWQKCYSEYNKAITKAFKAGNNYVADFDLVSFYELIDHNLLKESLNSKVKNQELLTLLFKCLEVWTTDTAGAHLHHGIPQGPQPSAFLAECFLFYFDAQKFSGIRYLRYVDDIKLMAKKELLVRRALLQLDLASKELGLVPQAQKIELRKVDNLEDILKTIPSSLTSVSKISPDEPLYSQKELMHAFRSSLKKEGSQWIITDLTTFKFTLFRLNPRKDILKKITPLLTQRPDCSFTFSAYLKKFQKNPMVADIIIKVLQQDLIYDMVASHFIEALDICQPDGNTIYPRVIRSIRKRSAEKSIVIDVACLTFLGHRTTPVKAALLIKRHNNPIVKAILLHRLFEDPHHQLLNFSDIKTTLDSCVNSSDEDLARFSAGLLLSTWPWFLPGKWLPPTTVNRSVKLLMKGLGLRSRAPSKNGVLDTFFKTKIAINIPISWRKALGNDLRAVENKCLHLQELLVGDPTARVLILDTFNESLIQVFSKKHPLLATAYKKAAGTAQDPKWGNWVTNGALPTVLPKSISWFQDVHLTRFESDMAHAKSKRKGTPTKPVSYEKAEALIKKAKVAWAELIIEWVKIL